MRFAKSETASALNPIPPSVTHYANAFANVSMILKADEGENGEENESEQYAVHALKHIASRLRRAQYSSSRSSFPHTPHPTIGQASRRFPHSARGRPSPVTSKGDSFLLRTFRV